MATANPPVRYHEDDNYEIELNREKDKIRTQFEDLTDRLKCRERELLEELDAILASYRSYRDEVEIVRNKVRNLETMKQRNEEELANSRSKRLQENIIQQIEEEIKSQTYPKGPQLVSFVCESNVVFSEINELGKLVKKVAYSAENLTGELRTELRNTLTTTSHTSSVTQLTRKHSSSLSLLTTPSFPSITDEEIIYEVNDATHFLSNCYPSSLKLEGKDWPTVLHYFVAKKFDLKRNHVSKILSMKDCQEVHLYSRNLRFQSDIVICWDMNNKKVMKQGLKAKFEQNPFLKDKLLNTGGSGIIERSTNDMYWSQLANGSGRNLMGQLLCEVRSELNERPSTPPNSSSSKWLSFESTASKIIATVSAFSTKALDHTSPH